MLLYFFKINDQSEFNNMREKVDKGFCFEYSKLSYRRRMVRNLWFAVISPVFFIFPDDLFGFISKVSGIPITKLAVVLFFLCVFVLQSIYNYYKWKKVDR